ncbi:MAG: 50S ribosomal protein L6 [Candidatus Micrarchaeota archaeon]|nr:50S ribosomal protein L6 [Candidatus Micrarchaeota archaeon]MCX8154686.1 50S ribosomal protein L6 [Candidatus Micrarchaeota archaeon]
MREIKVMVDNSVKVSDNTVTIGNYSLRFKGEGLRIWIENGELKVEAKNRAMINTVKRKVLNLMRGIKEPYKIELVARYLHFPIKLVFKNGVLEIQNFLGEKKPRYAKIPEGVKVEIKGQNLTISSPDKELLGQAYTNIKRAVYIKEKDRRIFQDGIYKVIT